MSPNHQSVSRIASSLKPKGNICLSCRLHSISFSSSSRRQQHTVAAATVGGPSSSLAPPAPSPLQESISYAIKAGVLLSRAPIITPDPHPFETAYQLYQRRLNERLVLPFGQYFYYKRDTPAFERWRTARRARNGVAARDIGGYNAYGSEAWNDEVLLGDQSGEKSTLAKQLLAEEGRAAEFVGDQPHEEEGQSSMAGLRRRTEADEKGDTRSLERALSRTLYLLVKRKMAHGREGGYWALPSGTLHGMEGLREAAERVLHSSCGPNMLTWFIGNHPIGHYVYKVKNPTRITQPAAAAAAAAAEPSQASQSSEAPVPTSSIATSSASSGEKTFFMKSRILKGQADPTHHSNVKTAETEIEDFQWLSKEEIRALVSEQYWASIRSLLLDQ